MPLQKSFSDTNHSSKQRPPQWSRNKSFAGAHTSKNQHPSKPLQDKPPLPVSSATKNKLSIFQFSGQANFDSKDSKAIISLLLDDEKENADAQTTYRGAFTRKKEVTEVEDHIVRNQENTGIDGQNKKELYVGQTDRGTGLDERFRSSKSSGVVASDTAKGTFPSTPAARLALPDLIGMEDIRRTVQNISPEDRIEWDPHSSNSSSLGIRKSKRRARSSSPISSPSHPNPHHPNAHIDPGSELWGRYSLSGSNIQTPESATIPALAQLLQTSSPRLSKDATTPRSVAGFRRTTSCGTQFPKRRRVGSTNHDDVFTESFNVGPSKLSGLMERVQEGLVQPLQTEGFSSSSSVNDENVTEEESNDDKPGQETHRSNTAAHIDAPPPPPPQGFAQTASNRADGSDYGDFDDDDLDDTTLLDAVTSQPEPPGLETSLSNRKPSLNPAAITQHLKPPDTLAVTADTSSRSKPQKVKEDEFDDSDDDVFAAQLEDVVARFDGVAGESAIPASSVKESKPKVVFEDSDDEFGDGGIDAADFESAEAAATQFIQQSSNSLLPQFTPNARSIQRYLVTKVVESEYKAPNQGRPLPEKILFVIMEQTKVKKLVYLRGTWIDTPVSVNAFVHIIGSFESTGRCIIDDANNILILHPDHLISATVVGDSFGCTRRAVLQDRVKATSDPSKPMLYGTILHELFQAAMLANRWDTEWLSEEIDRVATKHMEDLYTIRVEIPQAVDDLQAKMPELQAWAELFVSSKPKPDAIVDAGNGAKATMCVNKLLDVEEHVWSPMYGLKGNIDATVQVTMNEGNDSRTLTVPFELKTGKNPSAAHRAQTALYNLLLSDRYDLEIACGILYYMETSVTNKIQAIRNELRHMIMQRNQLACYVRERHAQLPPMLKKENMCNRCYAKVPCFIYHRLADDGTGETSGVKDKFDAVVKHLTHKHKEFFLKWDDLLTKEEKESLKFRRELWTMLSSEREKLGRCFSNVIIEPGSAYEDKNNQKINRYRYTMIKPSTQEKFSFLDSQIMVGEPIVISDEKGHFALANGYVTNVRKRRITVAVDRRLHNARIRGPGFDERNNQVFAGIMEVAHEGASPPQTCDTISEEPVHYRLDKDEFSNGMATVRNNLIQVMAEGPFGSREIRGLVVDLNAPRFKTQSTAYTLTDQANINVDQRRAIQKVMSAQDYALVLGMPGTGKTTTIAHIIRALISQGKSVLLTSYTHTAVDNILLKLKDDNIPILRLGNTAKINSDVQEFATLAANSMASFEEIKSAWHDSPIVATTCLGINHPIFSERVFDYCIVDEASQITLPVCLGPIRLARTFILVGDHYQLPPLVQSEDAKKGGLDVSLFKHLSDMHPSSVVYLEHQYRMCEDVMALSNNLIYNGRLKCGSEEVAQRRISIPNIDALTLHHHNPSTLSRNAKTICLGPRRGQCWIRDLLDPDTKVTFINTDTLLPASREEAKGNRIVNPTEVAICVQLVESLLSVGVPASDIGVMTHYRSQLEKLKDGLRGHQNVEMHTADRFQGRDKEVIILSLVRSNEAKSIGELLKDWRRINVAFTRAKTKLLVIGSRDTLKGNGPKADGSEEMVAHFIGLMEKKNWIYNLPAGALESHYFEDEATQVTASRVSLPASTPVGNDHVNKHNFSAYSNDNYKETGAGKKRKVLGESKENGNMLRQAKKKICGAKPFKIPRMSVMNDIKNDQLA